MLVSKRLLVEDFDPGSFITDMLTFAEEYYLAAMTLLSKPIPKKVTFPYAPAGYLASHAAELYLKAMIVSLAGYEGYLSARAIPYHDLTDLLNLVVKYDSTIAKIRPQVEDLNKFSGDKVRYLEGFYTQTDHEIFGKEDIWGVTIVKRFTDEFFNSLE